MLPTDFTVTNEGNIYLLAPLTSDAQAWVAEHIPDDAQRWCGKLVIEHRFIDNVVDGINGDGLTCEVS